MSRSQKSFDFNTSFGPTAFPISSTISPIMPSQDSNQYSYVDKQKANPIVYLIETEKEYIEDLRCLLQQVTNSWDHANPPPPELDVIFCVLSKIYHRNNEFCSRLMQVASSQQIGDALMEWNISAQRNQPVSLDFFFEIPLKRIHYYKKLYMRTIKSFEPGWSDYDKFAAAIKRMDDLVELAKKAKESNRPRNNISLPVPQTVLHTIISPQGGPTIPEITSSQIPLNWTLTELESQLDTSQVTDLFTKQLKSLNVVLTPPHLPFKREIVHHDDFIVVLHDGDSSNDHRAHVKAHLFLLTDLLLICQQFTPEERALNPSKELRLLYPPLSGRHLMLNNLYDNKEYLLNLVVLQKEHLVLPSTRPQVNVNLSPSRKENINIQLSVQEPLRDFSPSKQKLGLPSSPLSNDAPLQRSSSPQDNNISAPNSRDNSRAGENQERLKSPKLSRSNSMTSLSSVSSIGSFTETIHQTPPCEVNRWFDGEWIPLTKNDKCIVEIKMTSSNIPCWAVLLKSSGRMVLNAWIHPTTSLHRESPCSISVACEMGMVKEFYRMTLQNSIDSDKLFSDFLRMKNFGPNNTLPIPGLISRSSSLQNNRPIQPMKEIEQTMTDVMDSRVKLFLQSDHGIWTNLGWGNMILSLETPSHRKRITILSGKNSKLVDSFIEDTGVGRVGKSSVTFKINNVGAPTPIIYMMQMKDDTIATKAFDIMKTAPKS
ncbi:7696_t:CDS:2 [Funneliformis caledonium]|uniref:7696_t:CDS:1 n=1 Tax=Funneliformis caledonium TaxID=1117310 RepID=A0A9N8VZ72_9GLOM|nr:7696_t:CDS:2 [Funneliformis caledonium]